MTLTTPEILTRLGDVIRNHFNCPGLKVDRTTSARDVVGWDSLAHTMVLMRIEDEFGVELPMDRAFTVKNVGELADLVAGAR